MTPHKASALAQKTLGIIMGGGQGTRLFPLTRERSKPATPLAGKYRLVDIPISNCINSGVLRMYLLTQFNSASLHRHVSQSYKFDHFSGGFVEILAAEQSFSSTSWYQGTADAVRKNIQHFKNNHFDYALVLSGDQLYQMDFREIVQAHAEKSADVTIATIPVGRAEAPALGILQSNGEGRITHFVEKPKDPELLRSLQIERSQYPALGIQRDEDLFLASMGIYVFNREVLFDLLDNNLTDFGKHIIPGAIGTLASSPMSSKATGRTSAPSAASSRPTSTRLRTCRVSTSLILPFTPAPASSPPPSSTPQPSTMPSSLMAASSPTLASATASWGFDPSFRRDARSTASS